MEGINDKRACFLLWPSAEEDYIEEYEQRNQNRKALRLLEAVNLFFHSPCSVALS